MIENATESTPRNYLKVGSYTPATDDTEAVIDREFYGQGYIFKDEEAYATSLDQICYIPELSDNVYTHQDFLDIMDGQEELAHDLFDKLPLSIRDAILKFHNESAALGFCLRWGLQAAKEIREDWHVVVAGLDAENEGNGEEIVT